MTTKKQVIKSLMAIEITSVVRKNMSTIFDNVKATMKEKGIEWDSRELSNGFMEVIDRVFQEMENK